MTKNSSLLLKLPSLDRESRFSVLNGCGEAGFSNWPMFIITMLSIVVVVNIVFAYLAVTSDAGLIEQNPYQQSVHYQDIIDQEKVNLDLGWVATLNCGSDSNPGLKRVELQLVDNIGDPINDAIVKFKALRPSSDALDFEGVLEYVEGSEGRYFTLTDSLSESGLWLFNLNIVKDGQVFIDRMKRVVL